MIKQLCKNCRQNVILYQICCAQGQVLPLRDSAHFVRPRVCSANYPIVNLFWQDFVLQKIIRVRILFFMANDFNFNTIHPLWKLEGTLWVRGCKANGAVHIVNYIIFYNDSLIISYVLIAQLDRVFGYEPKGQGFEPWEGERRWENSPADCF